ncbi:hypothetical protein ACTXT7_017278 [Hymenolepis weldensis]
MKVLLRAAVGDDSDDAPKSGHRHLLQATSHSSDDIFSPSVIWLMITHASCRVGCKHLHSSLSWSESSRLNALFDCLEFVMENDEDLCDFVAGLRSLDYHLKLEYEMGRRVKMLVLKRDSPTIDSGAIPKPLVHLRRFTPMPPSARSATMPCPPPSPQL